MKNGTLHKFLKRLFLAIYILGTIGILFVGWQTYDTKNKAIQADTDSSLNTVVCGSGKGYKLGNYTGIHSKKDIDFLEDVELRYLCSRGLDIASGDKQKIVDFITGQDTHYFTTMSNIPSIHEDVFGNWPLANPTDIYVANPQLTDIQVEQAVIQLNHKYYDSVTYKLVNVPKTHTPVTFDYKDTFLTLILFLFLVYVLQKITFSILEKKKIHEHIIRLIKQYPFLVPALIIGIVLIIVVALITNNSNPQDSLAVNQKCHDLATKYVDSMKTKYNSNPLTNQTDYSAPYTYDTTLVSYAFNRQMNTCLAYYYLNEYVNTLASLTPTPLPNGKQMETTQYIDDVISGEHVTSIDLDTDCNMNTSYCQNLVDFSLKEGSLGLSHLNLWETLYLQTVGRLSFVRGWMGM